LDINSFLCSWKLDEDAHCPSLGFQTKVFKWKNGDGLEKCLKTQTHPHKFRKVNPNTPKWFNQFENSMHMESW
jgi:hypothetical protein